MVERILIIDCDAHHLAFVKQVLVDAGYEVLTAMDGEDGVRAAVSERPDLILVRGVLMVGQHTVHQRLGCNPRTSDIPVMFLASPSEVEAGWIDDDHLFGDYDPEQLLEKVEQLTFGTRGGNALISTGNEALDKGLGGGIPVGSLTLIEGEASSGKSTLARQIIWEALRGGLILTLFTSEDTAQSLVGQMRQIGLDVLDYLLRGKISVYPLNLSRLGGHALQTLLHAMKWGLRRKVMVVDSLSPALAHCPADEAHRFLEACEALCQGGSTVILSLHSYTMTDEIAESVRALCDVHLKLTSDEGRGRRTASVEICKAPGQQAAAGPVIPFEIAPAMERSIVRASESNSRRMVG